MTTSTPRDESPQPMTPTITELIEEMREHLYGRVALCQVCGGALHLHRDFTPDTAFSAERDDVYVTGPCVDEPNKEHRAHEAEIMAYAEGQDLERDVVRYSALALCDEIERLRAWLQLMRDEPNHSGYTLRHYAWRALNGQRVEDWQ